MPFFNAMWTKPDQLTSVAIARPLRVAYLIDLEDAPHDLFDAVICEAYGRWSGRRTLMVPAKPEGVDVRYREWLYYFDPDIIYSFVHLTDAAVAEMHERFGPAYLLLHPVTLGAQQERSFRIELPLRALSSLSVLSAYASRNWGYDGPPQNIKVLNIFWDRSESRFLRENFGFISSSFTSGLAGTGFPDLFNGMTLITEEALNDAGYWKDPRATYLTSEEAVLDALGGSGGPLTLAQLSEWFGPYLDTGGRMDPDGPCLVVGDTAADRLLFWNAHHLFSRPSLSEITTLRLPIERLEDDAFLVRVRRVLDRRGSRGNNNNQDARVLMLSCSVDAAKLEALADRLRKTGKWLSIIVRHLEDPSLFAPKFRDPLRVRFTNGGFMAEPVGRLTAEFQGPRAPVPLAAPWHMTEAMPPAGLRHGSWMVNVTIDRLRDHGRYANQRDVWLLPRRLRLERGFTLERDGTRDLESGDQFMRVMRTGEFGVPLHIGAARATIAAPDDLTALRVGITNNFEWVRFDRDRANAPQGRLRFAEATPSDKGRYLLGVLALFESLPDAFATLMHQFWRETLQSFGGAPIDKDPALIRKVTTIIRRRLGQHVGPVSFATDEDVEQLAKTTLRCGTMVAREARYRRYQWMRNRWQVMVKAFVAEHPRADAEGDDRYHRDPALLDRSIQYLCQRKVLFQGREWRCSACFNRNWVAISELSATLACSICGREEPAPVSGDWQFKANPFLIEAYRDHGTEAVVWALWRLWERSRRSFYFAPSLKLWLQYPDEVTQSCDAEIDAVVVVDGTTYLLEAITAGSLDDAERAQLVLAAEHIRPDVLLIASMERDNRLLARSVERIKAALPAGILTEVMAFNAADLDSAPFLPA